MQRLKQWIGIELDEDISEDDLIRLADLLSKSPQAWQQMVGAGIPPCTRSLNPPVRIRVTPSGHILYIGDADFAKEKTSHADCP